MEWVYILDRESRFCRFDACRRHQNNAQVVQLVGDNGLRSRTVSVRIRPWAPLQLAIVQWIVRLPPKRQM